MTLPLPTWRKPRDGTVTEPDHVHGVTEDMQQAFSTILAEREAARRLRMGWSEHLDSESDHVFVAAVMAAQVERARPDLASADEDRPARSLRRTA